MSTRVGMNAIQAIPENLDAIEALFSPQSIGFTERSCPSCNLGNLPMRSWLDMSFSPKDHLVITEGWWVSKSPRGVFCAGPTKATADTPIPGNGSLFSD